MEVRESHSPLGAAMKLQCATQGQIPADGGRRACSVAPTLCDERLLPWRRSDSGVCAGTSEGFSQCQGTWERPRTSPRRCHWQPPQPRHRPRRGRGQASAKWLATRRPDHITPATSRAGASERAPGRDSRTKPSGSLGWTDGVAGRSGASCLGSARNDDQLGGLLLLLAWHGCYSTCTCLVACGAAACAACASFAMP